MLPHGAMRILQELAASEEVEAGDAQQRARPLNDYRIETLRAGPVLRCFPSSCYLGCASRTAKIFELALDVLQREPEEVAFIDDRQGNCGMRRKRWEFTQFAIRMKHNACRLLERLDLTAGVRT